jgi:PAS domain S-box-containing protein
VRDPSGRVVGIVGVARDISQRRHLAEDLHRLQEFNEMVLNSIPTCLWTVDLDGVITWVNGALCRLADCQVGDLVDRSVFEDTGAWIATGRHHVRQVLDRGRVARAKAVEHVLPDGRRVYLDLTVLPLREEGEMTGAIVEAIDATERIGLQHELEQLKGKA